MWAKEGDGEQGGDWSGHRWNLCLVQQKRIGEDMDSTTFISQVHGIPPKQKEKDGW
jgi:hypothetical protein